MCGFREGETERLVREKQLKDSPSKWYFIVYSNEGEIKYDVVDLEKGLASIKAKCKAGAKLFMCWHGQYRTDIFSIDPTVLPDAL